jgi:dolichol-phosphate mannosyltransferase
VNEAPAPLVSVLVPVYNEAATVGELLRRLLASPYPDKQIVIVDDGSRDATAQVLRAWAGHSQILILRHEQNRGKGAAIRMALAHATGQIAIIQDADLEYDPNDFPAVIEPIRRGDASAVYGSRYLSPRERLPWSRFRIAVVLLNATVRLLYGLRLTDEATCYKAMPVELMRALDLRAERFDLCPEITAKLCRRGIRIIEVPIRYAPRSARDGKKIGWRDAVGTFWALLKWRFAPGTAISPMGREKRERPAYTAGRL